jgi:hypothetical protein
MLSAYAPASLDNLSRESRNNFVATHARPAFARIASRTSATWRGVMAGEGSEAQRMSQSSGWRMHKAK